jgi:CheY-like chemotaxis protein
VGGISVSWHLVGLPALGQPRPALPRSLYRHAATLARFAGLVDDVEDNRESFGLLVQSWGHEVRLAHDGPSALEAFVSFRPHAVLLDIGLPGMDGWQVARQIRRHDAGATLLVAVTGYGQERDRERSHAAGIDIHLVKPAEPAEVRRLLAEAGQLIN